MYRLALLRASSSRVPHLRQQQPLRWFGSTLPRSAAGADDDAKVTFGNLCKEVAEGEKDLTQARAKEIVKKVFDTIEGVSIGLLLWVLGCVTITDERGGYPR